ncbi:uncharacterized protein LOC101849030 [Aplysia californica]|uniref:Uncharacterized protein LOC101849030 n=1 Tax=Aplysia californica TaxID=6500 RepID=A0ABM1AF25_APLCA|nr:uncharacterized protein LOC101849030 [Aplysia californica]
MGRAVQLQMKVVAALVMLGVTGVMVRYIALPQPLAAFNEKLQLNRASLGEGAMVRSASALHASVNVVKSYPTSELPYKDCVPLPESPRQGVVMCVYPPENDIFVSKYIKSGRLFERELVLEMAEALKADPESQFVDLGANIGAYTLFAAATGHSVLAVDMLPANLHQLQTSLSLSGLSGHVTLVNNALYSDHRQLPAHFVSSNVGATHLNVSKTDFDHYGMVVDRNHTVKVNTICIDDLTPLLKAGTKTLVKMDIERTEARALTCAHNFFQKLDIRVVQMEWVAKTREEMVSINGFMSEHGFKPSKHALRYEPEDTWQATTPGNNVFFVKV